jgi:sugar lactone lactonase YvrE
VTDPEGKLMRMVEVPGLYVTNISFGADETMLYVTAATDAWTSPFPGEVYEIPNN